MAIQGRILALTIGQPTNIVQPTGAIEQFGYRPILSVQTILAKTQTTVLFGDDLYAIGLLSNFPEEEIFTRFVDSYKNRVETWAQLAVIPNPAIAYPPYPAPVVPPVGTAKLVVMASGWNASQRFWISFKGNYFLHFPIFKDWANIVTRDGPDYKGFQPSDGSPNYNGGMNGGNCK